MKKISLFVAALTFLGLTSIANAGFTGSKSPSSATRATVSQIKDMKDESRVVLQGYIESRIGGEDYMFKDKTGSIKVEIDDDVWQGLNVSPENLVEIEGEVDTHLYKPTDIEVESIKLVK